VIVGLSRRRSRIRVPSLLLPAFPFLLGAALSNSHHTQARLQVIAAAPQPRPPLAAMCGLMIEAIPKRNAAVPVHVAETRQPGGRSPASDATRMTASAMVVAADQTVGT